MSFVPAPQQANAASNNQQNASTNNNTGAPPPAAAGAVAAAAGMAPEMSDQERLFKMRTFDVFWVEKHSLMYRDGIAKVRYGDIIIIFLTDSYLFLVAECGISTMFEHTRL